MTSDHQRELPQESKQSLLAHALGHAVSRWANVEFNVVSIFATATKIPLNLASNVLGNVKTFSLLLDMCHSAVQYRLRDAPELDYWNSVVEYAKELSGDRNYMVHNAMVIHSPGPPDSTPPDLCEVKIGPDVRAALAGKPEKRTPFDHNELTELLQDFQELVELLMRFNEWLANGATSPEKYRAPVVRRRPPRSKRRAGD